MHHTLQSACRCHVQAAKTTWSRFVLPEIICVYIASFLAQIRIPTRLASNSNNLFYTVPHRYTQQYMSV